MNMIRSAMALAALTFALGGFTTAHAQAPAGAPANATGVCNDGSYWTGTTRAFSCRGHKGLKTWFTAAKPAATATAAPPPPVPTKPVAQAAPQIPTAAPTRTAPQPSVKPTSARTGTSSRQQAPGGGNGMVWVNTPSKVYHCQGDRYYGKTKEGQYVSESAAKAAGDRPEGGKPCSK